MCSKSGSQNIPDNVTKTIFSKFKSLLTIADIFTFMDFEFWGVFGLFDESAAT